MEISEGNSLCSYLYLKQAKTSFFLFFSFLFSYTKSEKKRAEQLLQRGGKWREKGVGR
jgi:hypothetical protein